MDAPSTARASTYLLPQSVFSRGIAYVIDTVVVGLLTAVLMTAGVLRGDGLESLDPSAVRDMLQSNSGLAVYVILFAYFLVCEGAWSRTVGKLALGLRVVRVKDGEPCGWSRSIVRNLIRPFDLFFAGLPGGLVVLVTPARQRIGDLLGGTLVVRQVEMAPAMAAMVPGLLRRCPNCDRLAPAGAACPGCGGQPPAASAAGQQAVAEQFGAAIMQPIAGMMAAGEAAGALRVAAQEVLAAESVYAEASAAESDRLARECVQGSGAAGADGPVDPQADEAATGVAPAPGAALPAESDDAEGEDVFVHTDDAPGLSAEYVAAWRGLMAAVETLRRRQEDLDAKLASARVPLGQVTAADPLLRSLLDDVAPYLEAEDDEAVLAAFMTRASGDATMEREPAS